MSADKANDSSAARKKKITLVLTVVVLIFLIWQMIGLFGSSVALGSVNMYNREGFGSLTFDGTNELTLSTTIEVIPG